MIIHIYIHAHHINRRQNENNHRASKHRGRYGCVGSGHTKHIYLLVPKNSSAMRRISFCPKQFQFVFVLAKLHCLSLTVWLLVLKHFLSRLSCKKNEVRVRAHVCTCVMTVKRSHLSAQKAFARDSITEENLKGTRMGKVSRRGQPCPQQAWPSSPCWQ
jgi:hypothetical protein